MMKRQRRKEAQKAREVAREVAREEARREARKGVAGGKEVEAVAAVAPHQRAVWMTRLLPLGREEL